MDLGLEEKVALVTGASAGLGFATAWALAAEGARVAVCSRDAGRIEAAAARIREETGGTVEPAVCDMAGGRETVEGLVSHITGLWGRLDIAVSNAGGPPGGRFADLGPDEWERAYNLTFLSTLHLCATALPVMAGQGSGVIVVITSLAAKQPIAGLVTSNTFRAGLNGLIKSIADEYGPKGIRANTVAPGYTHTERLAELATGISQRDGISIEEVYDRWRRLAPLRRLGRPEEVGAAIAFLCSERAAFITGQHLAVDGGAIRGVLG
jgi:3-oxoacyl-[acyl-carrier protein] reductase